MGMQLRLWICDDGWHMAPAIRDHAILRLPTARTVFSGRTPTENNAWSNQHSRMAHVEQHAVSLLQSQRYRL
jgi:hypothetical protein